MNSPDKSRAGFAPGDPPPNYSACVAQPTSVRSNDLEAGIEEAVDPTSEAYPLKGIHHHKAVSGHIAPANASSAPFLGVPTGSGISDNESSSPSNPYNPQPAYNPSYVAGSQQTPRPNVYGRKTVILKRTDAEIAARKKKILIGCCIGILIGSIIPIGTVIWITSMSGSHAKAKSNQKYYGNTYNEQTFTSPREVTIEPYSVTNYRSNFDETPWKPRETVTLSNPFLHNEYDDMFKPKPPVENNKDDDLLNLGIDKEMKELQDRIKASLDYLNGRHEVNRDHGGGIINPINWDILREDKTTKKPPLWK